MESVIYKEGIEKVGIYVDVDCKDMVLKVEVCSLVIIWCWIWKNLVRFLLEKW